MVPLLPGVPSLKAQVILVSQGSERKTQKPSINLRDEGAWAISPKAGLKSMLLCDLGKSSRDLSLTNCETKKSVAQGLIKFMSFQWESLRWVIS